MSLLKLCQCSRQSQSSKSKFPPITSLSNADTKSYGTGAADLDGTLLTTTSSFKYFMRLSQDAGSVIRAALLCLAAPAIYCTYKFISESAGIKILIFISLAGLKKDKVKLVAQKKLTEMYSKHLRMDSCELFNRCTGQKVVVTANPTVMVEHFVKELGAECLGTELEVTKKGRFTGRVTKGVLVGQKKKEAVQQHFQNVRLDLGLGDRKTDHPFMELCKEAYMVPPEKKAARVTVERLRSRNTN